MVKSQKNPWIFPGEQAALQGWETELFGGTYDEAKPFERCKYGALSVPWVNAIRKWWFYGKITGKPSENGCFMGKS